MSRVAPLILALAIAFVLVAGSSQPASSALLSSTATDISSGSYHSCALLSDSTVKCWGANFYGALGDGTTTDRVSPVAVSGIATATQVSSGHWHSCARLSDSTVKCWGYNGSGELGDGTTTNQLTPVSVSGITTATQVAAGGSHSCARLSDSTVKCWGYNGSGQLGDGTTTDRPTPVTVSGISTATEVSAGGSHTCARLSNNTARCWGENGYGQLGDGTTTNRSTSVPVSGVSTAAQTSAGDGHSCARLSDATLRCWGSNSTGQLGDGTTTDRLTPVTVTGITTAAQVSAGGYNTSHHSCARLADGTLRCWGEGINGQLGEGIELKQSTPVSVSGLSTATQISTGGGHSCARLSNSTVRCWGLNREGQLGDGTTTDRSTSVAVSGISNALQVSAGDKYTCAVLSDGTIKCWGSNAHGHFSETGPEIQPTPVAVSGISTATQVSAGPWHACARLSDSTLRCWGLNAEGRLGDGTTTDRWTPVAVSGITTATQVAAGANHTCARLSDSTLKCWGNNYYGQLGAGLVGNQLTPIAVSGITTATQVTAGGEYGISSGHSCARLADGTLRCWGENFEGELGDGTTTHRSTPVSVPGVTTATDVSAGRGRSCAALSDGTLRCWGSNDYGQIGDGSTTDRLTPTSVSGISTGAQVSTSSFTSCARLSDSTAKCWGHAYAGQLGNGALGYSYVPVMVALGGGGGPQPPTITTTSLPGGTTSQAYSQSVTASGGTTPYGWTVSAGALPPGLSLSATGTPSATIAGTPTVGGTYNFTVRVTDGAALADTQDLSIAVVVAPPPVNPAVLDNFNRPNENPVFQSGNWSSVGLKGGVGAPLSSNRLRNFPLASGGGYSYRVRPYLGGSMEASATIQTRPTTNNHSLSLFVCLQDVGTSGWDGYELKAINVSGGPDLWQIWRVDNGVSNPPTPLAATNFEMVAGGKMLLRNWQGELQFWWKPPTGAWQMKLGSALLIDLTYQWGMIGAGGAQSGALDDFGGGSLLTPLQQYAPELRPSAFDAFRAGAADMLTDNISDSGVANALYDATNTVLAQANWPPPDQLSTGFLGSSYPEGGIADGRDATVDDYIDAADSHTADAQRLQALPAYADKIYAREVAETGGRTTLQYWLFYYFNWHPDLTDEGDHEGDWEMVQFELDAYGVPTRAAYSQHGVGETCSWSDVERTATGRPRVFVSKGSHASYFRAGYKIGPFVGTSFDDADASGTPVVPSVTGLEAPAPAWLNWPGKWGVDTGGLPNLFGPPTGPKQQSAKWTTPAAWADGQNVCWEAFVPRRIESGASTPPPPTPKISATRVGKRVRIAYSFASWPANLDRRPVSLHTAVQSSEKRYTPYTKQHRISTRKGVVFQPLGLGKGPFKLLARAFTRGGLGSQTVSVRIRAG